MRHRISGYRTYFAEVGLSLKIWPFMNPRFYRIRRKFGPGATLLKALHFAYSTVRLILRVAMVRVFDLVIIHREAFPLGGPLFEKTIARLNPNVIYDLDDAVWHPPSIRINQRRFLWNEGRVSRIMAASAVVVAGNRYIARYATGFNDNVVIIPTPYRDLWRERGPRTATRGRPIVVWIGNLGNAEYVRMVMPVLEKLSETKSFTLRLIGGEDIFDIRSAKVNVEYVIWDDKVEAGCLMEADIGIMPLYQKRYEAGKCAFKIVQYFAAGLAVVASPVGMNGEIVREGINGYLAATDREWYEGLRQLLEEPERRCAMGLEGRKAFEAGFTYEVNTRRWLDVISGICPGGRA